MGLQEIITNLGVFRLRNLVGLIIVCYIFLYSPWNIYAPIKFIPELFFIMIISIIFSIARCIHFIIKYFLSVKKRNQLKKTFHATATSNQCHWHLSKQNDESIVIQLIAIIMVHNCTKNPISIINLEIKNLFFKKEIIEQSILFNYKEIRIFTTDPVAGNLILGNQTLPLHVNIIFKDKNAINKLGKNLKIPLSLFDSNGNKQTVKIIFKNPTSINPKPKILKEIPSKFSDPIEKKLVSILQLELCGYNDLGRSVGGLGSIRTIIPGQEFIGVGNDGKVVNSENQYIYFNPEAAFIKSENLDALLVLYEQLSSTDEKKQFIEYLLNRINEKKEYLSISYFIIFALWKLGKLHEGLTKVKSDLPQCETIFFGFSNVLKLINGMLFFRHSDFSNESLDFIEQFIMDLEEHTFMIAQKIISIRSWRLKNPKRFQNANP